MAGTRIEHDLLGPIEVPIDALWGAQTQRAVHNFPTTGQPTIGDFPEMVDALITVKEAAAITNGAIGALSMEQVDAIVGACARVKADRLYHQFPVHHLHGGGGTSANMNANEVLANLGQEALGGARGAYDLLHPNDHVNLHQSTNDVYPTACHLAVIGRWWSLRPRFDRLIDVVIDRQQRFEDQRRIARTCLQDAVDSTYGDLLGGYRSMISRCRQRLDETVAELTAVNLGATIVGRPADVPARYFDSILESLNELVSYAELTRSNDLFDAAQNLDDLVAVSSGLDLCARSLIKMAKDIRLLASGPEAGLGELTIPAVQPGSSIMPGKVNPVIPEFIIQVCFRVVGNHQMSSMAVDHGELDLNVWESPVVFGILESMDLLDQALDRFAVDCIAGIEVPGSVNDRKASSIIAELADLSRKHGYSAINAVCTEAEGDFDRIRALLDQRGLT